jgi:hypothetical protein
MLDLDNNKDEGGPEPYKNKTVEYRKLASGVGDP